MKTRSLAEETRRRTTFMSRSMAIAFLALFFAPITSRASSIAWSPNPVSGDWYTPENWVPQTVPNGPNDRAIFNSSSITDVSFPVGSETRLDRIVFSNGGFTLDVSAGSTVTLDGAGILGGNFVTVSGELKFVNYAADYSQVTVFGGNPGGTALFYGHSSSGPGVLGDAYQVEYHDRSQAVGTIFLFFPDSEGNPAGVVTFSDEAKAEGANFLVTRQPNETMGPAIYFNDDSTADGAFFELQDDLAVLDISGHNAPGITIGSFLQRGQIYLGANNLSVSQSNTERAFYGSIHDGGASSGTGGSLTLLADNNPTFTLSGPSDYTGGTVVEGGTLLAKSSGRGSVTGLGPVQVNAGGLRGHGVIAGAVTVGTGNGPGASLNPGTHFGVGQTLTIQQSLTFASDATYEASVNSEMVTANSVAAEGVTIATGTQLTLVDSGASTLPIGTTFTVIDNTAATPVAGTFSNLPDGATITAGANTYQASYEGGDGNDLTLTVVP